MENGLGGKKITIFAIGILAVAAGVFLAMNFFSAPKADRNESMNGSEQNLIKGSIAKINDGILGKSFVMSDVSGPVGREGYTIKTSRKTEYQLEEVSASRIPIPINIMDDVKIPDPKISSAKFSDLKEGDVVSVYFKSVENLEKAEELDAEKVVIVRKVKWPPPEGEDPPERD